MSKQLVLDLGRQEDKSFVTGLANQKARETMMNSKMLLILGSARSGKTGLCHDAEKRMQALKITSVAQIEHHIISGAKLDLLVDDVDDFVKLEGAQSALFHLYNLVKAQDQRLIMFAKILPSQWGIELADLRSRIDSLPIAQIEAPDDALIFELLANGFHARGVLVSNELIQYLLKRLERSYVQIEQAIDMLDQKARSENGKVSLRLANAYFGEQDE